MEQNEKMRMPLLLLTVIVLASGCGMQEDNNRAGGNDSTLTDTEHPGEMPSNEEMLIGARNQVPSTVEKINSEKHFYSKEDAKQLVRKHLKLQDTEGVSVTFEGFKEDFYLFHVSEMVHFNNQPEKMSRGWYVVDPTSGEVTLEKNN